MSDKIIDEFAEGDEVVLLQHLINTQHLKRANKQRTRKRSNFCWIPSVCVKQELLFENELEARARALCCQFKPSPVEQTISLFRHFHDMNYDERKGARAWRTDPVLGTQEQVSRCFSWPWKICQNFCIHTVSENRVTKQILIETYCDSNGDDLWSTALNLLNPRMRGVDTPLGDISIWTFLHTHAAINQNL